MAIGIRALPILAPKVRKINDITRRPQGSDRGFVAGDARSYRQVQPLRRRRCSNGGCHGRLVRGAEAGISQPRSLKVQGD